MLGAGNPVCSPIPAMLSRFGMSTGINPGVLRAYAGHVRTVTAGYRRLIRLNLLGMILLCWVKLRLDNRVRG